MLNSKKHVIQLGNSMAASDWSFEPIQNQTKTNKTRGLKLPPRLQNITHNSKVSIEQSFESYINLYVVETMTLYPGMV